MGSRGRGGERKRVERRQFPRRRLKKSKQGAEKSHGGEYAGMDKETASQNENGEEE
jgi:hypothetical protein